MKNSNQDKWFNSCDDPTLCRMGGNGPINVTQLMPLIKYTRDGETFLDIGCGSGTTLDAILEIKRNFLYYKGTDFIEHRINWLKSHYQEFDFEVQDARKIEEADKSFDVVWSRHVVDHLDNFYKAIDEQCRVAKKRVICILFMSFSNQDEDEIKPIMVNNITYTDEWQNQYSKKKVLEYLEEKKKQGWDVLQFEEDCVWDVSRNSKGHDTVIVLERINA